MQNNESGNQGKPQQQPALPQPAPSSPRPRPQTERLEERSQNDPYRTKINR